MTFLVCSEHGLVRTKKFETEEEAASYARVKALENHGIVYYVAEVKIEYSTKPVLIEGKIKPGCYIENDTPLSTAEPSMEEIFASIERIMEEDD